MRETRTSHLALLVIVAIVFCWSGWRPYDRFHGCALRKFERAESIP